MPKLYNIDNYETHRRYYELYTNSNSILNNIIQSIIQTANFEFNPKKYYRLNTNDIITRNIYELSGIIIMLNAIIEKTLYGYCIKNGKKYKCEKMHCCNVLSSKYYFYTYHFNCSENEFIIMFGWEYFSPILIYYPKTNDIYNINYRYSNINEFISAIITVINYNIAYYPRDNYISYVIGITQNPGHYFWQEIFGLMLLIENNLIDNIDEFIIYNFDYLNIGNILKTKFNKKITYLSSENNNNLTLNLSKHYITNSLIETFKNIYDLNYIKNNSKELNILFDIRSNDRIWLNQMPIILNIMNNIKHNFNEYSVNFYISGFYKYENNNNNLLYNANTEISSQNETFHNLQSNVSFPINNLINLNLSQIIPLLQKIDLCIANLGSGTSFFFQTIFNKHTIGLTTKNKSVDFNMQRYAFENKLNKCILIHPCFVTDIKNNFKIKEGFLVDIVLKNIKENLRVGVCTAGSEKSISGRPKKEHFWQFWYTKIEFLASFWQVLLMTISGSRAVHTTT